MVIDINNIGLDIIGLYRGNYRSQFHIRQMAKLIGKSHVGILPHLKAFEKEGILASKEVGKSKVFELNLNNNQAREFLSLSEKKKSLEIFDQEFFLKKIFDEFIKIGLDGCLVLFGSYASKTHTEKSDIDLLYIGELAKDKKDKIIELGKTYNKSIHLVSINVKQFREQLDKKGALVMEIIANHIILYNHDLFVNEVWRYYNERK